ncbi:Uncharacterised protein [Candidatus Bartonella washoeensis]|uniref:Uncharacterized protein n=1 Tax=Candidatus Bartonella washoeensis Sb944nv TaxID=1094563 RepID=J1J7J0_9HYPH|nr:hypothetical protein [Bartonella washoeensis]EJF79790.1 hypothetical protein MCQ_00643 [Bartonella washoeensis Sb944nv]SPU26837.1 Uncharacterised protein [Bartonella washoeensis]
MRNFGSGLVYNLNDSTPVYGNACGFNDFMSHMNAQGFDYAVAGGLTGAAMGAITGPGALMGGITGATTGFLGGFGLGFAQKAHECWF